MILTIIIVIINIIIIIVTLKVITIIILPLGEIKDFTSRELRLNWSNKKEKKLITV